MYGNLEFHLEKTPKIPTNFIEKEPPYQNKYRFLILHPHFHIFILSKLSIQMGYLSNQYCLVNLKYLELF